MLNQLARFLRDRGAALNALPSKKKSPDVVSASLARAAKLAEVCDAGSFPNQVEVVTAVVRRVIVGQDKVTIDIGRNALTERLLGQEVTPASEPKSRSTIMLEVSVRFRRRGVEAKLVVLNQQDAAAEPDANLVKALARAHDWFWQIVRGEANGIGVIARRERLDRSYVTRMVCLALLAPEMTSAIIEGRQPTELTAKRLKRSAPKIPLLWADQVAFVASLQSLR